MRRLVHDSLGLSTRNWHILAAAITNPTATPTLNPQLTRRSPQEPLQAPLPLLSCHSTAYPPSSPFAALNTPIYLATDSPSPRTDPLLAPFFDHLPCAFTLDDFRPHVALLQQMAEGTDGRDPSDYDGLAVSPFLVPFLEAEVASKGWVVVGTPGQCSWRAIEGPD